MPPRYSGRPTAVAATSEFLLGFAVSASLASGIPRLAESTPSAIRFPGQGVLELALMDVQSSARTVSDRTVIEPAAWLTQAKECLAELARLPDDWGGSEKPSERALGVAWSLIQSMERRDHRKPRIAPMADGGLSVRYIEGRRSARFDVYNEGGIVVATRTSREVPARYAELPEFDAVAELSRFLQRGDDATSAG